MAGPDNGSTDSSSQLPVKTIPKDALVMAAILKEIGVTEYEPRVINQMIEFCYRYVTDVVEDARVYSLHANRKTINIDDVKLAVSQKLDHSFTSPPPREFLLDIARTKNSQPLPLISDKSGLRLPPERYCLTSNNYKIKAVKKNQSRKSTASNSKAALKITSMGSNPQRIVTQSQQIITNLQNPQSQTNANSVTIPTTGVARFPSMLKRKHDQDDDYDI